MSVEEASAETTEYRVILVQPDLRKILTLETAGEYCLPRVQIPKWTRPTEQLQKAVKARLGLCVFVLDFLATKRDCTYCAIAELLSPNANSELRAVTLENISESELSGDQRAHLESLMDGSFDTAVSRLGWIDDAIAWVENSTQKRLSSKRDIEQFNAGGAFSLIRFRMDDGQGYWLKATGMPNTHEYSVTKYLYGLSLSSPEMHGHVPSLIAVKPEWNAWLTSGEGRLISEIQLHDHNTSSILEDAARSLARLQIATVGFDRDLMRAGAFDQRLKVFVARSQELFEYLEEAMRLQTSTKVIRIERLRFRELRIIFVEVCNRMAALDIPDCILHGDLNSGNIIISGHCQFIDWSEAYVGNPLISLQHLLLLNKIEDADERERRNVSLKKRYRREWFAIYDPPTLSQGFRYMPMLAAVSALYGRGEWLNSSERDAPHRQSFARTLARHIDRAARTLDLQEATCQ